MKVIYKKFYDILEYQQIVRLNNQYVEAQNYYFSIKLKFEKYRFYFDDIKKSESREKNSNQ